MAQGRSTDEQLVWERSCHWTLTSDVIWRLDVYRASLYFLHIARADAAALVAARRGHAVADQMLRAAGSVSANVAEGYSRTTRVDRLRFLAYALGSARECMTWYQAAKDSLADEIIEDRFVLLTRIRSLLLGLIRSYRESTNKPTRIEA